MEIVRIARINTLCACRLSTLLPPRHGPLAGHIPFLADFLADYEMRHRLTQEPLDPAAVSVVQSFPHCGDLASGFI